MEHLDFNRERQANGLREFMSVVFKYKAMILAVFFAVVVTVTVASFIITPVYESGSSVLVKIGREYMNRPEVGNNAPIMSLNQEEVINSEIQIFKNRDLIEKVIAALTLEKIYPELLKNPSAKAKPMDAAIAKFLNNLKVEGMKKSSVIQVSFRHTNPVVAADAVNLLLDFFKEKHLQVFSDPKSSFLETQLVTYDQKLKESENSLQVFKQKSGVYSLEEQRKLLLEQRAALDTGLKSTQSSIQELQKKVTSLKGHIAAISRNKANYTNTERDRIIVDTQSRLLALQLNEQDLLKKYTENNRLVLDIRKQIAIVRGFLKEQESDINSKVKTGNQVYQNTEIELIRSESELNAQKGKAMAMNQQLAEVDGSIRSLDYSEKDMQKLKREQAINEKNYQAYQEKTEEARITDDMNRLKMSNITVIQKAIAPPEPIKPKKMFNIALAIVLGMVSGLGLAFLSESTSQSFSTPEQVENRLGLPVLAAIAFKEE
jgi:polysaccharide biosynthesis protein PslE